MIIQYYWNNITGKHKEIRQKESVGRTEDLYDEDKVESKGKNVLIESLLYASIMLMEGRI